MIDMNAPVNIESVLLDAYLNGGNANTLKLSDRAVTYLKRWVLSGVIATEEKRHRVRAVKGARRRNRGRAPFARFR